MKRARIQSILRLTVILFTVGILCCCMQKPKSPLVWRVEFDESTSVLYMKKISEAKQQSPEQIIAAINDANPKIVLQLSEISHDTIFVSITKASYLTQQSGTAGTDSYLATVVYNLTESNRIKFINFNFEEGDHAIPGTYSRADFITF